jgi:seryl-tRNA synthetase
MHSQNERAEAGEAEKNGFGALSPESFYKIEVPCFNDPEGQYTPRPELTSSLVRFVLKRMFCT